MPAAIEGLSDYDVAEAIRDGKLKSPQKYGDFYLFALRVTGTGAAYRDSIDEYAVRDPRKWLSDEFVKRCNGLSVIWNHPDRAGLNTEEYRDRAIGVIVLPYVKDDEVWGIAKIFDEDAALAMQTTHRSTSPGVMPPKDSKHIVLDDGTKVLDEDLPLVLDHLAVCEQGVWDKNGPPEGIRLDSTTDAPTSKEHTTVSEEEKKALEKERDDYKARADAAEAEAKELKDKARKDAEAEAEKAAEKEREDKARKDAEEAAENEKKDKARKDRHDSEKHDGSHKDCARCDSDEKESREDSEHKVNANAIEDLKDAARKDSARIQSLEAQIAALSKVPSEDTRAAIAEAFHRADSAFQMLGEKAPRDYHGENPIAYRKRLANELRKHLNDASQWKGYEITESLDEKAFQMIESAIYTDAADVARNPSTAEKLGSLRAITREKNGRTVTEFIGDSRAFLAQFAPPMEHRVLKFNTDLLSRRA